jgi:glycosyltransferase involved in cell wall biosynthesis
MRITVITPSYRNSDPLKLCVASVADQEGVEAEHIVQDAGSDDGTLDWLLSDIRVKAHVEKDEGMYDAINRGLRKATGEILAYLNCDEQYLPGALEKVAEFFQVHPDVDVIFADAVIVDAGGNYICHRKVLPPTKYHTWLCHLGTLSCATFFRRKLIDDDALFFDPRWRTLGDAQWILQLLQRDVPTGVLRHFTSTFTDDGENLSLQPNALQEKKALSQSAPGWAKKLTPLFVLQHRLRRLLGGIYFQRPFAYSLYTRESPDKRVVHAVKKPTFLWRSRL